MTTDNLPSPDLTFDTQSDDQPASYPKTYAQSSMDVKSPDSTLPHQMASTESPAAERTEKPSLDPKTKISNLLKDKTQEWTAVKEKQGPLRLLDLPMDVLKEIVKEVTHTNDLTALALTHSALHNLAIPHIYSRFDIVWPDAHATTDPRTGVDALTYGLATLCMGDIFSNPSQDQYFACVKCGTYNTPECNHNSTSSSLVGQRRLGNHYPQFTRKFSLGNGPVDWVQEYLITKESGKMLGTLVALAVARMTNLETFVWDMPTGVLRDVWLALSSLQRRNSKQECRLERVWVRWHDNSESIHMSPTQGSNPAPATTTQMLPGSTLSSIGWTIPTGSVPSQGQSQPISYAQSRVEYPTLSVLPPLRSLSVLDIDELDYLDEMSMLIAKSKDRLRELRVGIAAKAVNRDFAIAWDGPDLHQVDHEASWPGASKIGERRLGGVLGILMGRVFDIRKKPKPKFEKKDLGTSVPVPTFIPTGSTQVEASVTEHLTTQNQQHVLQHALHTTIPLTNDTNHDGVLIEELPAQIVGTSDQASTAPGGESGEWKFYVEGGSSQKNESTDGVTQAQSTSFAVESAQSDMDSLTALISAHQIVSDVEGQAQDPLQVDIPTEPPLRRPQPQTQKQAHFSADPPSERERLDGKLRLQTLELERVPLSVAVLQKSIDWSVLTNLTILDCPQHDRLWVMLRKHFQPSPLGPGHSSTRHSGMSQYYLNLRKVHTDAASPSLIAFLKETLAPNTLETLFLQDRKRSNATTVTIDAIYRGPLKRHRSSLKKLMLDSSDRIPRGPANNASDSTRWRAWMPNRDVLNFITSGKMNSLRELSIAIDYKDWHHFLQRLPQIPHVRSLNIPFIADHVTAAFDPRELALQVVDVIVLRPEVELCYMGVSHKCFEILENRPTDESHVSGDAHSTAANGGPGGAVTDDDEDDDDDDGSDEDDDDEEEDDNGTAIAPIDPDETESEISDHDDSDDTDSFDGSEDGRSKVRLRLREILFYDDKVAIFKARHGKL